MSETPKSSAVPLSAAETMSEHFDVSDLAEDMSALARAAQGHTIGFMRLTQKFVDSEHSVPEESTDILYYTLSVGHHTGVIDCFRCDLQMPDETYKAIVDLMTNEEAKQKLSGIFKFGEIEIWKHQAVKILADLRGVFSNLDVYNEVGKTSLPLTEDQIDALVALIDLMMAIRDNKGLYVLARRM